MKTDVYNRAVGISFFAAILFLFAAQLLKLDFCASQPGSDRICTAPVENRRMSAYKDVKWSVPQIQKSIQQFNDAFNDSFGLRSTLIFLRSAFKNVVLKTPSSTKVVFGKNNWLFYTHKDSIESYRHANPYSPEELEDVVRGLISRTETLAQNGIQYFFVVAPNAGSVYPENLPNWISPVSPHTRTDQLVSRLKELGVTNFIDLRPALIQAKAMYDTPIYYQADIHWNALGAYYGYKAIVEHIRQNCKTSMSLKSLPGPIPLSEMDMKKVDFIGGDLSNILALPKRYKYKAYEVELRKKTYETVEQDPHQNFVTSNRATKTPRVMVFRDSFFMAMVPYFSQTFGEVIYRAHRFDRDIVAEKKPELIVDEIVEYTLFHKNIFRMDTLGDWNSQAKN